jgi:hypothetical protein
MTTIILLRNCSKQSKVLQYQYSVCRFFGDFDNLKLNVVHLAVEIIHGCGLVPESLGSFSHRALYSSAG